MSYKDDYKNRIDYLKKTIPILQQELACLESHFTNKKKVNNVMRIVKDFLDKSRIWCRKLIRKATRIVLAMLNNID